MPSHAHNNPTNYQATLDGQSAALPLDLHTCTFMPSGNILSGCREIDNLAPNHMGILFSAEIVQSLKASSMSLCIPMDSDEAMISNG